MLSSGVLPSELTRSQFYLFIENCIHSLTERKNLAEFNIIGWALINAGCTNLDLKI
jgi:hypothetical protein